MKERSNLPLLSKYEKILKEDPNSLVFAPLAEIYRKSGEYKKAVHICDAGLQLNPNYVSGKVVLANCYYEMGNFEKSKLIISPLVSDNIDNILLQKIWGKINLELGSEELALDCFKRLLFMCPRDEELSKLVNSLEKNRLPVNDIEQKELEQEKINLKQWQKKDFNSNDEMLYENGISIEKETPLIIAQMYINNGDYVTANELLNDCNDIDDESLKDKVLNLKAICDEKLNDERSIVIENEESSNLESKNDGNNFMSYFDQKIKDFDLLINDDDLIENESSKEEKDSIITEDISNKLWPSTSKDHVFLDSCNDFFSKLANYSKIVLTR